MRTTIARYAEIIGGKRYDYLSDEHAETIRTAAIKDAQRSDDLWSFVHHTLMNLVEYQGGKPQAKYDGFYRMKEFDVNGGASFLQAALEARAEFIQDRAENDKSS